MKNEYEMPRYRTIRERPTGATNENQTDVLSRVCCSAATCIRSTYKPTRAPPCTPWHCDWLASIRRFAMRKLHRPQPAMTAPHHVATTSAGPALPYPGRRYAARRESPQVQRLRMADLRTMLAAREQPDTFVTAAFEPPRLRLLAAGPCCPWLGRPPSYHAHPRRL